MPQLNKSETVRQRLRYLLQRLIDFANHELADCEHLESKIRVRWVDLETSAPKLIVKTEIRFLAALVSQTVNAKTKEHLKQDLRSLKDFVGRLEDNRDRTQGTSLWHFTLKLWHRSTNKNLIAFDELWQQRKAATKQAASQKKIDKTISQASTEIQSEPASVPGSLQPGSTQSDPLQSSPTDWPTYHNLPARDYGTFIGRKQVLEQLMLFLEPAHPVSRVSLTGIGGIGKTAIAIEAAHLCLARRQAVCEHPADDTFSVMVFVSAKTQRLTPQGILPSYRYSRTLQDLFRAIAQTLKRPDLLVGDFEHQLENTYEMLSWQRTLLIIDNLESLQPDDQQAILSFLYELPTTVKAIVTSRTHLTMDAIIPLQALSESDSLQFIQHQASLKAISLSEENTRSLYAHTGGVPAAVVYALGRVAAGYPIPTVLPALTLQASDYCRYYLESTVNSLKVQPAYSMLMILALFPGPAPVSALTYIAQLTAPAVTESLVTLKQLALLTPGPADNSFSMLPLTREYMLTQLSTPAEVPTRERWMTWHSNWLGAYRHLNWREWHDYSAIDAVWENLQAVVEWCIANNRYEDFEPIWDGLRGYTHLRGYWNERLAWLRWWLAIAQQKEDALTTMKALRDLGWTLTLMGQPHQLKTATQYFSQAWEYRHEADTVFQLDLAIESAILCLFQNNLSQVQLWLTMAESLVSTAILPPKEQTQQQMRIGYYTAQLYYRQGNYAQAKSLYEALLERLTSAPEETPRQAEVYILNWLVDIALQQTDLDAAEQLLAKSWSILEHRQDKRSHAFHLRSKAQLERLRGNLANFQNWSQQAKACFETLGMQPQAREMQAWLTDVSL